MMSQGWRSGVGETDPHDTAAQPEKRKSKRKCNLLSKYTGVEIHSFRSHIRITPFGVEIHAQNSGIHSQKSDLNHYFGVDSTILRVDFHSKRSDP